MIHYTGYYFCSQSNWDGEYFHVRNLVSIDEENAKNLIDKFPLEPSIENRFSHSFKRLKPEVFDWLLNNVKDEKLGIKGWCCGNDSYNAGYNDFSLFFYRRKDARNFIKTWSIYKKPTETYNQNTYVNKVLNPKTNTLQIVKR
jgi:hypothetical protein